MLHGKDKKFAIVLCGSGVMFLSACCTQPPSENPVCKASYRIYEQCYKAGIGESTKSCADLAAKIIVEVNTGNPGLEVLTGLFCGEACNRAANQRGALSYPEFSNQNCNKL